eukprot:4857528-Pleurochrysis_carterae.AAC.1
MALIPWLQRLARLLGVSYSTMNCRGSQKNKLHTVLSPRANSPSAPPSGCASRHASSFALSNGTPPRPL